MNNFSQSSPQSSFNKTYDITAHTFQAYQGFKCSTPVRPPKTSKCPIDSNQISQTPFMTGAAVHKFFAHAVNASASLGKNECPKCRQCLEPGDVWGKES